MNLEFYLLWLGAIFPLVYSPGPGNLLCAICGAAHSLRGSVPFILGLNCAYTSYALLAGFGMASVLAQYPTVFFYIQLLGCAYLFYLSVTFFTRKVLSGGSAPRLAFKDGFISQALNIKGVSIILLMYSQFLTSDGDEHVQVFKLVAMLATLNLFTHCTWALGGAWMVRMATAKSALIQNRVYGVLLFAVGVWLLPVW